MNLARRPRHMKWAADAQAVASFQWSSKKIATVLCLLDAQAGAWNRWPMSRHSAFLLRACLPSFLFAQACSSSTPADFVQADASADVSTESSSVTDGGPSVAATDLGKTCAGGCAGSKICTVTDSVCSTSHCLFDGREAPSESYCTADCSSAACPTGFVCIDVPFQLKRACARDRAVTPGGSSVRGSIKLTGGTGPAGTTPTPFALNQAFDAPPASTLATLRCGEAWITTAPTVEKALFIYAKACDANAAALVTFYVPLDAGSYPTKNMHFPSIVAQVGPSYSAPLLDYGSRKVVVGTLDVTDLTGVSTTALPWTIGHTRVTYVGTLPKGGECTGPTCASGDATVAVELNLELTKVSSH